MKDETIKLAGMAILDRINSLSHHPDGTVGASIRVSYEAALDDLKGALGANGTTQDQIAEARYEALSIAMNVSGSRSTGCADTEYERGFEACAIAISDEIYTLMEKESAKC